ncbi:MAG: hypothetical protein HUJ22_14155 [Gracilimonas sp.]|uniref:hypothetical protein n=1 Tax=Gracilimonas sp. TaxID=1974203 RepID=UPI0019BF6A50|nr:hypothetical protein [Gracilimonas sp.]MBD3617697.1 hypothetical protein [Gracilimonas sp.]
MPKKSTTYKKFTINLVLIALFLCTLFGNGLHLHSIFNHLFDHGDIHTYVHVHPVDTDHSHNLEFDDKDAHQHPTATVDLTGTLTQKTTTKAFSERNILFEFVESPRVPKIIDQNPELLDLPPPDFINSPEDFPPLFLRGPPLG